MASTSSLVISPCHIEIFPLVTGISESRTIPFSSVQTDKYSSCTFNTESDIFLGIRTFIKDLKIQRFPFISSGISISLYSTESALSSSKR